MQWLSGHSVRGEFEHGVINLARDFEVAEAKRILAHPGSGAGGVFDQPPIALPAEPTTFELSRDASFEASDIKRFIDAGGTIVNRGFRVFVRDDGGQGVTAEVIQALGDPTTKR